MHSHSEFTWEFAFIVSCTHKWMLKVHRRLPGCIPYYIPYCIPRFCVRIPSSRKSDRNAYNCIIAIIKIESVSIGEILYLQWLIFFSYLAWRLLFSMLTRQYSFVKQLYIVPINKQESPSMQFIVAECIVEN